MSILPRVPIRLRLTLVFALAAAVILAALGALLYVRLDRALEEAVDRGLRARAADVVAAARVGGIEPGRLATEGEGYAQILSVTGAILDSSPQLRSPVLTPAEISAVEEGGLVLERSGLPGSDEPIRLLARPLSPSPGVGAPRAVVVVGTSTEPSADARESLATQLLVLGPLTLLVISLAAYALAAAALRPVEAMRSEAEAVSVTEPGRRLTVPPADDELAHLAETLNAMLARLETALQRERRFVADAGHELRTPLASLRAELELALRRERSPEELRQALRSAAEETERLSRLAEDLLVLARSTHGTLAVRREHVDVGSLLERVAGRHAARVRDAGRTLEVAPDPGIELLADGLRLEQALGNLVENALRHGEGTISLRAARGDGVVELCVRDEGAGLDPDVAAAAFQPFTKADRSRATPGAGLGLAIVAAIAEAHGGTAQARSGPEGADVWISLPLVA